MSILREKEELGALTTTDYNSNQGRRGPPILTSSANEMTALDHTPLDGELFLQVNTKHK